MELSNSEEVKQRVSGIIFFVPQYTTRRTLAELRRANWNEANNEKAHDDVDTDRKLPRIRKDVRPTLTHGAHHLTRRSWATALGARLRSSWNYTNQDRLWRATPKSGWLQRLVRRMAHARWHEPTVSNCVCHHKKETAHESRETESLAPWRSPHRPASVRLPFNL